MNPAGGARPPDVWVYRDGKVEQRVEAVLVPLIDRVERVETSAGEARRRCAVDALVVAGELEAALADAALPSLPILERATDALAEIAIGRERGLAGVAAELAQVDRRGIVSISSPEGFAYYALHPESYARAMREVGAGDALVVGIRSIGTTLSAIGRAALIALGARAERVTVRPGGHAHDRTLAMAPTVRAGATVVIVDEGPGLSGSTFLATVEAFERAGVPRDRIVIVCSHPPDPPRLRARDAEARWRALRTVVAPPGVRAPDGDDLSGGRWRNLHYTCEADWPEAFVSAERRKVLVGGARLFKYEGLGVRAEAARDRAVALAAAGFSAAPSDEGDGWWSCAWSGRPLAAADLDEALIDRMARYCAERTRRCQTGVVTDLSPVVAKNALELGLPAGPVLRVEAPAIVDGRLAPHEWLREPGGAVSKTDVASHGDDHFFPGPTDAAWDLAGAIVEWRLDAHREALLLERYRAASGDDAGARIDGWIHAYAVCRAALAWFAREQTGDARERARLRDALERYRSAALGVAERRRDQS